MSPGRLTVLLLAALTVANAQCFAACSLDSCSKPRTSSSCHGTASPGGLTCTHQTSLSEAGARPAGVEVPQAISFAGGVEAGAPLDSARVCERGPAGHSPPSGANLAFSQILRI